MIAIALIALATALTLLVREWDRQLHAQLGHLAFGKEQRP